MSGEPTVLWWHWLAYLLGERYIDAVRLLAQSPNAKTLLLPADVLHAVQGILGRGKP